MKKFTNRQAKNLRENCKRNLIFLREIYQIRSKTKRIMQKLKRISKEVVAKKFKGISQCRITSLKSIRKRPQTQRNLTKSKWRIPKRKSRKILGNVQQKPSFTLLLRARAWFSWWFCMWRPTIHDYLYFWESKEMEMIIGFKWAKNFGNFYNFWVWSEVKIFVKILGF